MPVVAPQQVTSSGAQLVPLVQPGGAPFFSSAAGMTVQQVPSSATTAGDVSSTSVTSSNGGSGTASTHAPSQTVLPQTLMAPFQLPSGSSQMPIQTQLALSQMLAPIQGVQPSVVVELNTSANKDGIGKECNKYLPS